jgi:Uma2 family endonuclease
LRAVVKSAWVFFTINVRIESERHRVYTGPTGRHDAMTTATPRRDPDARPRATYQDVLDAPPHRVAEIVDGALYTNPRPAMPHAVAASLLGYYLTGPFQVGQGGPGGWWIIDEPELHLGDDVLVPDIAGWRRSRMPNPPDGAYVTLAPDWVCEILSPSTRGLDLDAKRPVYAREGVRHLWLVDPDGRTLEAFELTAGERSRIATVADDAVVQIPPFEAASFSLADLWP